MALGSTQHLTEMSTRVVSWGKGDRWWLLTTLSYSRTDCLQILAASTSWSLRGPVQGRTRIALHIRRLWNKNLYQFQLWTVGYHNVQFARWYSKRHIVVIFSLEVTLSEYTVTWHKRPQTANIFTAMRTPNFVYNKCRHHNRVLIQRPTLN
jgi:hypothetical protein